jgi:hypothetical protein
LSFKWSNKPFSQDYFLGEIVLRSFLFHFEAQKISGREEQKIDN